MEHKERNNSIIASHQYEIINFDDVQKTIAEDIPILKQALAGISTMN